MKKSFAAVLVGMVFLFTSCASIIKGGSDQVTIRSAPPGAEFKIRDEDGKDIHRGITPSTVNLSCGNGFFNGQTYSLEFYLDGYSPYSCTLDSQVSAWYLGNVILGGLIGMLIVDPATGAMWALPDSIDAGLYPIATK